MKQSPSSVQGRAQGRAQRGPAAEPLLRGHRQSPLKLKALKHLHTYKEGPKFADNMPSPSWHWQLANRHNHHEFGPLWAERPAGSRGRAPGQGSGGFVPLKLNALKHLHNLKKAQKFAVNMRGPSKCGTGSWQTDATVTSWPTLVPHFCLAPFLHFGHGSNQ